MSGGVERMNRRGFLGSLGLVVGAVAIPTMVKKESTPELPQLHRLRHADGDFVGVAAETVYKGDFLVVKRFGLNLAKP